MGISSNKKLINFNPYYTYKDILGFIIFFIFISFFVFYIPNFLSHSDNYIPANPLVTPAHISPEFYFLPFYAILRSIPNKRLGVIAMVAAILLLLLLPKLHNHIYNSMKFRLFYKPLVLSFITSFLLLL
jgi:quinol-cytochrome oxidoreductase complex cytochrome b subunit